MQYSLDYYFNEKEFCFYLEDRVTKFEDLFNKYKDDKTTNIIDDIYEITKGNYIYPLKSPGNVHFVFPDGAEKEIFISSCNHIIDICAKFKSYDFFYCNDESEKYINFDISNINKIYPVKKIKITIKQHRDIYDINNKVIKDYSELSPKTLSLEYKKYLKFPLNIEENSNFFNHTEERKNFFECLDAILKGKNIFLPICGLEGIGMTSSILAYCRMKIKYFYFYFNVRAFSELLKTNNEEEIKKLLIIELTHCLNPIPLHNAVENILNYKSYNCNTLEFLIKILKNIHLFGVLIIDQYKTSYDEGYNFLKELINEFNSSMNIILLSSMNEDDVKLSIIKGLKREKLSEENFFLNYLYISKLAYISDDYIKNLSDDEKIVLDGFGNLFSIFYEIMEFKKENNGIFNKEIFLKKIKGDIKNNLITFYKGEDKIKIYYILKKLNDLDSEKIKKDKILKDFHNIPFRYIQLNINNNYIFKIDTINDDTEFTFNYIYKNFFTIINELKSEYFEAIKNDEYVIENIKKEMKPLKFEDNTFDYIWGSKEFNREKLIRRIAISSFYNLNNDDCKKIKKVLEEHNDGEGAILSQNLTNAAYFDKYIFVKINNNNFKLYYIQITTKKEPKDRLTITFLNDIFGYIIAFLKEKFEIIIAQNFFCYIFDENFPDTETIEYCIQFKLDYLLFNQKNNSMNYPKGKINEYKMRKKIFEYNINFGFEKEFEIQKFYPKVMDLDETKKFIKRKRFFTEKKNYQNENDLVQKFVLRENYYKSIERNFKNKKKIDFNDREEEINDYLVEKEFLGKNLVGILHLIPDQKEYIQLLNNLGLTDSMIDNFFTIIGKDRKKFLISNIKEIPYYIPSLLIPEYKTYIIVKTEDKLFYQDYQKKKSYNLTDKAEEDFNISYNENWKLYVISLINGNLSREINSDKFKILYK